MANMIWTIKQSNIDSLRAETEQDSYSRQVLDEYIDNGSFTIVPEDTLIEPTTLSQLTIFDKFAVKGMLPVFSLGEYNKQTFKTSRAYLDNLRKSTEQDPSTKHQFDQHNDSECLAIVPGEVTLSAREQAMARIRTVIAFLKTIPEGTPPIGAVESMEVHNDKQAICIMKDGSSILITDGSVVIVHNNHPTKQ